MALRRPHERDEKLWAAGFSPIVWRSCPSPSGFQPRIGGTGRAIDRWNDEVGGGSLSRIVVRDMLS